MSPTTSPSRARGPESAPDSPRSALLQLLTVVGVVVLVAVITRTTDWLIVIAAIVIMVMVHELGHFATAKWSGMKVTEYFLGFGPRLWSVRRGETEYGVKAIPAGGYVRIIGMSETEEVDPADEPRTYRQQPFHNRLAVAVAGSVMHFVMAFVLLWGLVVFIGIPNASSVSVSALAPLSGNVDPAASAGIRPGDIFESVDGVKITSVTGLQEIIAAHVNSSLAVVMNRDGRQVDLRVTPEETGSSKGRIGVVITNPNVRTNPLIGFGRAGVELGRVTSLSISGLGTVFSPHGIRNYVHDLTNTKAAGQSSANGTRPESIVGAVRTAAQGAQEGMGDLIIVLVSINVFVGLINMFPMLPLDGGHVLIACYERIRSRRGQRYRADVNKLTPFAYALLVFLGFIFLSSLYLDIVHPVANPFR
jgi:membrane-associated protease RseP (regulator of RpoE activity)